MNKPSTPEPAPKLFPEHGRAPDKPEAFANSSNIEITPDYEGFNQHNDMFSRGLWDASFANRMTMRFYRSFVKPKERARDEEGFGQEDFALRNGPWVVTEMFAEMHKAKDRRDGFTDDFTPHLPPKVEPADMGSPDAAA